MCKYVNNAKTPDKKAPMLKYIAPGLVPKSLIMLLKLKLGKSEIAMISPAIPTVADNNP
ncbi:unnamed protein product [marine sediment metagenome]|uniref:Uncharacterized protein n=1 Tax=marine sediment metagenome TaxID=412755 RepID=X1DF02_9ZZZZ